MNCKSCGAEVKGDDKFCSNCGEDINHSNECKSCHHLNEPGAAFCERCGFPLKSDMGSVSDPASPALSRAVGSNFAYLLDEDSLRDASLISAEIPYGGIGVTLVDGKVEGVRLQQNYDGKNKKNAIVEFLTGVYEGSLGLVGQRKQSIKTYFLLNLQDQAIASYAHPIPTPGELDATLRFNFWIDARGEDTRDDQLQNIGVFFQRCMGNKRVLTLNDFKNLAKACIPELINNLDAGVLRTDLGLRQLEYSLLQATGISSRCSYARGKKMGRRFLDVSKVLSISCPNPKCDAKHSTKLNFCDVCGWDISNIDWVGGAELLQAENKEAITLRLSLLQDEEPGSRIKTDEEISQIVIQHLGPILRRKSVASLMDPSALIELESILNGSLSRDFQGYISDIKVVDIRTENEDWFFKVDALIKEELRKIETETQLLAIDESKADFDEAKFTVALRRIKQGESEELALRKSALQAKMNLSELDIEEHALDTKTDLRKEGIDSVAEKERMARDRELNRDRVSGEREDEISDVDHKLNLDKKVATHDIDMNDLTGEAASRAARRLQSDKSFEEEEKLRIKNQDKEAQLKRVQEMRLQQMMAVKQDQEFELAKAQSMKGMSAQEILAMQAAQLVKAGATNAADKIAESLGDAKHAESKDQMYKDMLKVQQEASQMAVDAHKSAAEMALKASENMAKVTGAAATTSNEGYKEAAKIAQTTNEKSMESMSKVATAAAGKKSGKDDKDQKDEDDEWECTKCGRVSISKLGKHCTGCGQKRPTDD